MQYIQAVKEHTASVFELVQETIRSVYPKYYPGEVVDFFCSLHSREKIAGDIENGSVGVLVEEGRRTTRRWCWTLLCRPAGYMNTEDTARCGMNDILWITVWFWFMKWWRRYFKAIIHAISSHLRGGN